MTKDTKTDTDILIENEEAPKPKRRTRAKKATDATTTETQSPTRQRRNKKDSADAVDTPKKRTAIKEAVLEFAENDNGALVLREVGSNEVLVSIDFAEKIKEILGKETIQAMGHHMIQAAISSFMQRQMDQWHAHVHEETPERFS